MPRTQVIERDGQDYLKMNLYGKEVELKIDGYQDPSDKSRGQFVSIQEMIKALDPDGTIQKELDASPRRFNPLDQ